MDRPSSILRKQRNPTFFKILMNDFPSRLKFPPVFTNRFGRQIPNTTKLEVKGYHEKSWEVEVEKDGKIQCFSKGWREFVEENNLEELDFLVFKYLVDSKSFKVTIYGRTGCVKEFLVHVDGKRKRVQEDDDDSDTDHIIRTKKSKIDGDKAYDDDKDKGTLKKIVYNGKTKEHRIKDGGKRKRVQQDDDDSNREMKGARMTRSKIKGVKTYGSDVIRTDSDHEDKSTLKQPVCKGKTKEIEVKFNSKNPFFGVKLRKTHIKDNGYLHIPLWFFMEHLSLNEEKVATFHIGKHIWQLDIYTIENDDDMGTKVARICSGWPNFVKENGLKKEDFCIFEVIESNVALRVHVYRKAGEKKKFVKIF